MNTRGTECNEEYDIEPPIGVIIEKNENIQELYFHAKVINLDFGLQIELHMGVIKEI